MYRKERAIEQYLVRQVKSAKGMALKVTSPSMDGVPDRLVMLPECLPVRVELKAPGQKPRPLQVVAMSMLRATHCMMGIRVLDSKDAVDYFIASARQLYGM